MSYGYDLTGSMTKEVYPSGRAITISYDDAGRLDGLSGTKDAQVRQYVTSASYTAHGAISSMALGNGLTETSVFNSRLQPTAITVSSVATGTVFDLSYKYGVLVGGSLDATKNNGNVQSQEITISATTIKQSYLYDALNRISSAEEALNGTIRWTQAYEFDRFGNRTLLTNTGADGGLLPTQSTPGVNGPTNRLVGFSYDTSGNLLGDGVGNTFTYDAENRQVTHTRAGVTTTYVYDGEGRRVNKEGGGVTTIFVYNAGSQLIAEYVTPDQPVEGGGGTSYLTTDHLGSTRLVTDVNKAVKSRRDYCPYGEELGGGIAGRTTGMGYSQADGLRQKFTRKERDVESGLDYFLARYYSAAQGRFTSVDPANADPRLPQDLNRYTYTLNNPLKYTDLTGEKWAVQYTDGQARFKWYEGDAIPTGEGWEGKWEEYTAGWYIGEDAVVKLGGRGPDDVLVIDRETFVRTGGEEAWAQIQKADPANLTREQQEIIFSAAVYYPDRIESFRKMKLVAELGGYLLAAIVRPGPLGRSPKNTPPSVPTGMSQGEFGRKVMQWGNSSAQARARIQTLTTEELERAGVTRRMAKQWRNFYREEAIANPSNPSAAGRADLMQRAVELLKKGK